MTRCKLLLVCQSRVESPRNLDHTLIKRKNQDMEDITEDIKVKIKEDIMEKTTKSMVAMDALYSRYLCLSSSCLISGS